MDNHKRLQKIQETIATKKAEKAYAEKKRKEIIDKLKEMDIEPDDLGNKIIEYEKELEKMDNIIKSKLKEVEDAIK